MQEVWMPAPPGGPVALTKDQIIEQLEKLVKQYKGDTRILVHKNTKSLATINSFKNEINRAIRHQEQLNKQNKWLEILNKHNENKKRTFSFKNLLMHLSME